MERIFRAGGAYDLVVFDRLTPEEQVVLAELCVDPEFYGVLRPSQGSGSTIKAIGRDTALLWLTLQSPGPLPSFFLRKESDAAAAIAQMVLDGVLEMEVDGRFIAGSEAALVMSKDRGRSPVGRLARLSQDALRYAENLGLSDPAPLAARIYGFGRQPMSPCWARLLKDAEAVLTYLAAPPRSVLRRRLDRGWETESTREMPGWIVWSSRRDAGPANGTYKLYVSPVIEAMPQAFSAIVDVLEDRGGHFKIGANAAGLLRPDKIVLYFTDRERLLEVSSKLTEKLSGVPAHGVPFSAEIAGDGLLSWGMDPPKSERILSWQVPESWRLWVVRRLAVAIVAAQRGSNSEMTAAEFALERLRYEGVDVDGWAPASSLWRQN